MINMTKSFSFQTKPISLYADPSTLVTAHLGCVHRLRCMHWQRYLPVSYRAMLDLEIMSCNKLIRICNVTKLISLLSKIGVERLFTIEVLSFQTYARSYRTSSNREITHPIFPPYVCNVQHMLIRRNESAVRKIFWFGSSKLIIPFSMLSLT